MLTWI